MAQGRTLAFGPFRLDRVDGRLWQGDVEKPLRGKSFALLRYLAEHPGRLVTRDELLRAVWPGVAVSPSVVRVSVHEVREALGEHAETPRFLETVGRQGYRFLAAPGDGVGDGTAFVGRDGDLAVLHHHLDRCRSHRRETVFVTGEPGIGKTTLLERFADEVRTGRLGRVAVGQCVELNGPAEPYLPVLDLLGALCRDDDRDEVVPALERWAPSWLLQMPGVVRDDAMEALRRRIPVLNRERMLRELADAVDALARETPLVLVLEDLHWSDASTVDLLAYLAERSSPARLLVVGTYRPVDLVVHEHPLRATVRHLVARERAVEAPLELLGEADVRAFLVKRLGGADVDPRLPAAVHARTDGNPLFLVSVVRYLLDAGALARVGTTWRLAAADEGVPQSLRELVARQIEVLSAEERGTLEAASVVGVDFDAGTVAAACDRPAADVDRLLVALAERGQHVCTTGTAAAEGGLVGTYDFVHGLHQSVLYRGLAPAERSRLHRRVGAHLEAALADTRPVAATLASHFERGGDVARAVRFHAEAVECARARLADREIAVHCRAVLGLLDALPDSAERRRQEMAMSLELAVVLTASRGFGAVECEPYFERAGALARRLELPQVELLAHGGLCTYHLMRGALRRARELASDLLALTRTHPFPLFATMGHATFGCTHYLIGQLDVAREHFAQARTAYRDLGPIQVDPIFMILGIGALVHHDIGDTATGAAWCADVLARADAETDPLNAVNAYQMAAQHRLAVDDRAGAVGLADRAIDLARAHAIPAHEASAMTTKGWALRDAAMVRTSHDELQTLGLRLGEPTRHLALAEIAAEAGRLDDVETEIAAGLAAAQATGEVRHVAELHRMRAACARHRDRADDAERALRDALEVAHAQGARLFVLRAAADLADLLAARGRRAEARALVAPLARGFVPDGQGRELDRVRALGRALA